MAKRVILAVAGAGKTYYICHAIDPDKRNLILAFTHENVHNIHRELKNAFEKIPEKTTISTFDSFVYHELILPYEPTIATHFKHPDFVSSGITVLDPPARKIQTKNGTWFNNSLYKSKNFLEHYFSKDNQYYCANLSELVMQIKNNRESLIKRTAKRLNKFYDTVLIDEFQDFRKHDYDLIIGLAKGLNDVLLVGDYYQHSVSGTNNSGKPFKKNSREVGYIEYIEELKRVGFEVDIETLKKSRRCSIEACEYVRRKLGINILSAGINNGDVIIVKEQYAENILNDNNILKLVYHNASKFTFHSMNWSYSKGNTIDKVCVILTDNFEKIDEEDFCVKDISNIAINRLYVAMTRSKGDLYLMKSSIFKKMKDSFSREN